MNTAGVPVREGALALGVALGVTACGVVGGGPPADVVSGCEDVRMIIADGMQASAAAIDGGPKEFSSILGDIAAVLRVRAQRIEDVPLRQAVSDLADSYASTADLTEQQRSSGVEKVRRAAADIDRMCEQA